MTQPRDPAVIREEIAEAREELGEAVEALAAKTDIKARAREKLGDAKQSAATLPQKAREHPTALGAGAAVLIAFLALRGRS